MLAAIGIDPRSPRELLWFAPSVCSSKSKLSTGLVRMPYGRRDRKRGITVPR